MRRTLTPEAVAKLEREAIEHEADATEWRQTDTGAARRFRDRFGDEFRYCEDLGGWLHYDGSRFERKATAAAYQRIAETADAIWAEVPKAPPDHRKELGQRRPRPRRP